MLPSVARQRGKAPSASVPSGVACCALFGFDRHHSDHPCPMPDGPPTMKVTKVTPRLIEREMGGNLWNPRTRWTKKRMVLVFIETDTGLFGVGEGWTTGGSARALVDIEDDLAPVLPGQDPHFVARFGLPAFRRRLGELRRRRVPHAAPVVLGPRARGHLHRARRFCPAAPRPWPRPRDLAGRSRLTASCPSRHASCSLARQRQREAETVAVIAPFQADGT
jgi:hypothetical protein